jgi:probable F420-dependent oxidoreductase
MVRPFRFGVQARVLDRPEAIASAARVAEDLGYDEFYSYDHFGAEDPFIPLMIAAQATSRLRVGPLVLNNEFHQPALLARTAATVDRLTGGRLVLGFGTGYDQAEHDAIGVLLRDPPQRVCRLGESLAAVRSLLDCGSADMAGAHHTLAVTELGIRPTQARVPFLIGGNGRRLVALAGRYADIFQFTGLTHEEGGKPGPGGFRLASVLTRNTWLVEAAAERLPAIERSILVQVTHIGSGAGDQNDELAQRWNLDDDEVEQTPFALVGSIRHVIDKLEWLRSQLGISHVVVRDAEGFAPVVAALAGH